MPFVAPGVRRWPLGLQAVLALVLVLHASSLARVLPLAWARVWPVESRLVESRLVESRLVEMPEGVWWMSPLLSVAIAALTAARRVVTVSVCG